MEPGVETFGTAQRGQVTPGSDERLLDGILGLVGIAQDEPGGGVQPEDRGACQRGEGVMIAPSRSLHEFLLHHAPRRWRGRCDRAQRVWRGDRHGSFRLRPGEACDAVPSRSRFARRRSRAAREDPGSRREVVARRPGPAGPRLGGRPHGPAGTCRDRADPRRRCVGGRHQGAGPRRRARQGRRRQAGRQHGRGGARRGLDPRDGHQGHHGPQGARRARRPTSSASTTCRPSSTARHGGSC